MAESQWVGNNPYPEYLRSAGFRFVERMSPTSNKIAIREQSAARSLPKDSPRLSSGQFSNIMHNQRNAFELATADQRSRGLNWYPVAHQIADTIHPADLETSAGVIAALSAGGGEWGRNVRNAEQFLKMGTLPAGHDRTKVQVEQARRIREGEHYLDVLKGQKTSNFARLIVNPYDEEAVAVDTHHHDASTGLKMPWKPTDRGIDEIGRYNTIADATRTTASRLGVLPSQLQAVDWVVWKELNHPKRGLMQATDVRRRVKMR